MSENVLKIDFPGLGHSLQSELEKRNSKPTKLSRTFICMRTT